MEKITHALEDIVARGLTPMDLPATVAMPGMGFMVRHRAHHAFRLTDGQWHYFRWTDEKRAQDADEAASGPVLPKPTAKSD